jgi:hypothetical protein
MPVHAAMLAAGAEVLDAPADYADQPGYAAFYADLGWSEARGYEPHSNREVGMARRRSVRRRRRRPITATKRKRPTDCKQPRGAFVDTVRISI